MRQPAEASSGEKPLSSWLIFHFGKIEDAASPNDQLTRRGGWGACDPSETYRVPAVGCSAGFGAALLAVDVRLHGLFGLGQSGPRLFPVDLDRLDLARRVVRQRLDPVRQRQPLGWIDAVVPQEGVELPLDAGDGRI